MQMYRIVGQQVIDGKKVGGLVLEGERLDDSWDVSEFEVNGHREVSIRPTMAWTEVAEWEDRLKLVGFPNDGIPDTEEEIAEKRLNSLAKSAKRATTMCRRVIKAEGFNEMLTLTYRANQSCRETAKRHFKEWVRRMKRALGGFRYCASFERQERGAMHVHIATHKLPEHAGYRGVKIKAWQLGTKIWRDIVGEDNGLCFVGGKSKFGAPRKQALSLARMAMYVSKYIMKDFADSPDESNRYSRSNGTELPKKIKTVLTGCSMVEAILAAFTCKDGDVIVSHRVDPARGSYWLCTEPRVLQ